MIIIYYSDQFPISKDIDTESPIIMGGGGGQSVSIDEELKLPWCIQKKHHTNQLLYGNVKLTDQKYAIIFSKHFFLTR